MYLDFSNSLVFLLVACGFVAAPLLLGRVLRPSHPTPEKLSTYECGEDTIGTAWIQFNIRFYIVALIFLIFDVEIALLIPWTTLFQDMRALAFLEMMVFLGILVVGFAYVWVKGDLEWLKSLGEVRTEGEKHKESGAP